MAIVEMQKLSVCGVKKNRKQILEFLQRTGAMEVNVSETAAERFEKMDTGAERMQFEKIAESFDQALELLKKYAEPEKTGLSLEKKVISRADYDEVVKNRNKYYDEVTDMMSFEKSIAVCNGNILRKQNRIAAIRPWTSLDIPLNTTGTKKTSVIIGSFPEARQFDDLYACITKDLGDAAPVTLDIVGTENQQTQVVVIAAKKVAEQVEDNMRMEGFTRLPFLTHRIPNDAIEKRNREIAQEQEKISEFEQKIAAFAANREKYRIASDYFRTRAEKYRVLGTLPQSKNVFFLEGWVPKNKAEDISKLLSEKFEAVVEFEEKGENETEPTLLRNNAFSASVEGVLESYGLPQHGRVDPTFVMSIFYVFFFGMMLSDAGYGILISIATAVLLMKFPRMEEGMKKMMKMFFWCGLSTAFWGFMYGGFFGDAIDVVARTFFDYTGDGILKPLWFAPLENPMRLLIWCMLFGLIHLFAGLAMKGYEYLRDKDVVGFISDIISWYMFITGLVLMLIPSSIFASIAGTQIVLPDGVNTLAKVLTIAGLVVILLMSGRANKNWGLRVALGAYDIYGVTGWLSDVLSYSRLLALGLATGVIANVINMMASMGGKTVIGVVVFILVFIFGHILNIGINMLGAYVHTNRLQFVEFFGKFYDGGGEAFRPFKTISKYIEVKEEK